LNDIQERAVSVVGNTAREWDPCYRVPRCHRPVSNRESPRGMGLRYSEPRRLVLPRKLGLLILATR
jgi:hypothetical protein